MIAESLVREVKRLLAEGRLSQRKIALLTGVSRGTVGAIASGRRCDHPRRPRPDDELDEPTGPPERCSDCGAIVYPPCRLCRLRKLLAAQRFPLRPERSLGPLGLELRENHRKRYEEIRLRRRRQGEPGADGRNVPADHGPKR